VIRWRRIKSAFYVSLVAIALQLFFGSLQYQELKLRESFKFGQGVCGTVDFLGLDLAESVTQRVCCLGLDGSLVIEPFTCNRCKLRPVSLENSPPSLLCGSDVSFIVPYSFPHFPDDSRSAATVSLV
jgi:hypothetical protein